MENNTFDFTENRIKRQASILNCYKEGDALLKAFESELEKGGEGSKGGKVIGHTKSGKAIYTHRDANHESYKDFTQKDHSDAADVHYASKNKREKEEGIIGSRDANHKVGQHDDISKKMKKDDEAVGKTKSEKESTQKHIIDNPYEAAHKLLDSQELNDDHTARVNAEMKGKTFTTKDHQEASKKALLAMHNEGKFSKVEKSEQTDLEKAYETLGL